MRSYDNHELALSTWTAAQAEDWLGRWAMNLMLINVSTRKLRRAVRLPEGDLPALARREAADFEVPSPAMTGRSPSRSRA